MPEHSIPTMPTPPLIEVIRYHRENPPLHFLASTHAYQIEWQVNSSSRQSEIRHVEEWARRNNLKVNPAKYQEIIFVDKRWYGFASPTEIHRIDALLSLTVVRRTDLFLLV